MDDRFDPEELLYRAVYPPDQISMFWRKDGTLSSAAFADAKGLSVERGYFRNSKVVVCSMQKRFSGIIVSLLVMDCISVNAVVRYLPSKANPFHSEIHGSETSLILSKSQRLQLSRRAMIIH